MAQAEQAVRGLVLAGGGAKGSYQVGVWRALMELDWRPGIITGTSVGCLNGVLFVMDAYETARDMWLTIRSRDVMTLPEETGLSELHSFLRKTVAAGGLDVTPLEAIIDRVLDEEVLRRAPIRFGLVTVESRGLRPCELPLEEIPQGKVKDYLLASAACFPALRPREIDGKKYLDGGYTDNMPQGLAKRMGATELVCVDIDGVGITRPNLTGLPTTVIRSHWDLGDILRFSPEAARRNMELGYYDTLRAFGRLRGSAYAVEITGEEIPAIRFRARYDLKLEELRAIWPALALSLELALARSKLQDLYLAPLEAAAEAAGVDPARLYTVETLGEAFVQAYDPQKGAALAPLFQGEGTAALAARAAVSPMNLLQALVYRALTERIDLEVSIE